MGGAPAVPRGRGGVRCGTSAAFARTRPRHAGLPGLAPAHGLACAVEREERCPVLRLPESWDAFSARLSGKDRHELRRKMRKLEAELPDVRVRSVTAPAEGWDTALTHFCGLHRPRARARQSSWTSEWSASSGGRAARDARRSRLGTSLVPGLGGVAGRLIHLHRVRRQRRALQLGLRSRALAAGARHCPPRPCDPGRHRAPRPPFDFLRGDEPYKYAFGPALTDLLSLRLPPVNLRVAVLSVHTCPLAALGGKETGGMNVYVREFRARARPHRRRRWTCTRALRIPGIRRIVPLGERRPRHPSPRRARSAPCPARSCISTCPSSWPGIEAFRESDGPRLRPHPRPHWLSGVAGLEAAGALGSGPSCRCSTPSAGSRTGWRGRATSGEPELRIGEETRIVGRGGPHRRRQLGGARALVLVLRRGRGAHRGDPLRRGYRALPAHGGRPPPRGSSTSTRSAAPLRRPAPAHQGTGNPARGHDAPGRRHAAPHRGRGPGRARERARGVSPRAAWPALGLRRARALPGRPAAGAPPPLLRGRRRDGDAVVLRVVRHGRPRGHGVRQSRRGLPRGRAHHHRARRGDGLPRARRRCRGPRRAARRRPRRSAPARTAGAEATRWAAEHRWPCVAEQVCGLYAELRPVASQHLDRARCTQR